MSQTLFDAKYPHVGSNEPPDLHLTLANCVEGVGVGLVATEWAKALIAAPLQLVGAAEHVTPLVVLAVRGEIGVDGQRPTPGIIVQAGLMLVPPDGTGDVNVATCWYYTSNGRLAHSLRRWGIPAHHVPKLAFEYLPGQPRGTLSVEVPPPVEPPLALDGSVGQPNETISFVANWWASTANGIVKMTTTIPRAVVGEASLTLTTDPCSALGTLIGGPSLEFAVLQRFNTFAAARLELAKPIEINKEQSANTFANHPVNESVGIGWIRPNPVICARSRRNKPG
ncbi:MAG: hypothetical protein MUD01_22455, partial [Chloroflexaceae bacterium]|nr:hypothetical protein [Chloroflexaceae bacterium]